MNGRLLGRVGARAGINVVLGDVTRLGAASTNDVRVHETGVSRMHARVIHEGADYWVEDVGSTNGTFVNGQRVTRMRLAHLDVITLGRQADLIFLLREERTPASPMSDAIKSVTLEFIDGAEAGTTIEVPKGEISIGRAAACNVMVSSTLVSKVHAKLVRTSEAVTLQDLGSANGTFVNGERITDRVELHHHDAVSLAGARSLRVVLQRGLGAASATVREAPTENEPVFDQNWRTRMVWSPEELAEIEAERAGVWHRVERAAVALGDAKPSDAVMPLPSTPSRAAVPEPSPQAAEPAKTSIAPPAAGRPAPPPGVLEQAQSAGKVQEGTDHATGAWKPAAAGPLPQSLAERAAAAREATPANALTSAHPAAKAQEIPAGLSTAAAAAREGAPPGPVTSVHPAAKAHGVPAGLADAAAAAQARGDEPETSRLARDRTRLVPAAAPIAPLSPVSGPIARVILEGAHGRYVAERGERTLGRGADAGIHIDSREVSRIHATIGVDSAGAWIEDHGSANGTFLNGQRVTGRAKLSHGDRLAFAELGFRVVFVAETP